MRQVDQHRYDDQYYFNAYGESVYDEEKQIYVSRTVHIYDEVLCLLKPMTGEKIVDYGCGSGDLAFYLAAQSGCAVIGLDYSSAAISACKEKLARTDRQDRISFINCNNDELPDLRGVRAVVLCDVIEHLHDEEVAFVLKKFRTWETSGRIRIIVHTDNDLYLKAVKPIFDFLFLLLRKTTLKKLEEDARLERELHVNLTTPGRLRRRMKELGFKQIALKYPTLSMGLVRNQLGGLGNVPGLAQTCLMILKTFRLLSPSFYAAFEDEALRI